MAKTSGGVRNNTASRQKAGQAVKLNQYTVSELIKTGARLGKNRVEVTFNAAYNEEQHKNLPERLKQTLKKSKKSIFSIITEPDDILKLLKDKDVKSVNWI